VQFFDGLPEPDQVTRNLWISIVAAIALIAGSGVSHMAEISYLPSILMFIAAVTVLGVSMMEEDILIQKYDTPHEEDTHPPQLIMLRMVRGIVLIVLGTLFFVLAF
jgi:hypothetical protein